MTRDEFLRIVEKESLVPQYYDLKKEPGIAHVQDTYGWAYLDGKWCPYETDERGGLMYYGEYDTESGALEDLLETLRRRKRIAKEKEKRK